MIKILFDNFKESHKKEIKRNQKRIKNKNKNEKNSGLKVKYEEKINEEQYEKITDSIISLIDKKIQLLKNPKKQDNIYLSNYSMSSIGKFCFSIFKLLTKFKDKTFKEEELVDLIFDLLFLKNPDNIKIKNFPSINEIILKMLSDFKNDEENIEEKYSFDSSENLNNFVEIVYLSSLINIYLCVESPPGYGKTTAARAIAEMRENGNGKKFYIQTFHSSTYPTDLYGSSSIINGQINFNEGPLTRALIEGKFFIADELNISPMTTILSIVPALELIFDANIYVPGMCAFKKKFNISSNFFLIICQNNVGIIGRIELPSILQKKIRKIHYPTLNVEEIQQICIDIDKFLSSRNNERIGEEKSKQIGKCMHEINEKKIFHEKWSLRDVSKLIGRLQYQKKNGNIYEGFELQHNILFFALSRYNIEEKKKYLDKFCDLLMNKETLELTQKDKDELIESFFSNVELKEEQTNDFISFILKKKNLSIILKQYDLNEDNQIKEKTNIYRSIQGLKNLLESLFQMKLTNFNEPLLIIGPSCYKTFASSIILEDAKTINLNRESTISQLLGSPLFFSKVEHRNFCLDQIYEILKETNKTQILNDAENWESNKDNIEKKINDIISFNKEMNIPKYKIDLVNNIKKKLFYQNRENRIIDLKMDFKPGLILSAIFTDKFLILKNISKVKTSVLERFNELLSDKNIITLTEDTTNTFTSKEEKEIKGYNNFRIIGTSSINDEISLSESILSRFTIIAIENYLEDEEKSVLEVKAGERNKEEGKKDVEYIYSCKCSLTFSEILNCISISKKLDLIRNSHESNLNLSLFICENGKKESNVKELYEKYKIKEFEDNVIPFELSDNKIISKRTGLSNDLYDQNIILSNKVYFTNTFSELCELIHFACALRIPLILDGEIGQGKKTAINLMAEVLGLTVIHQVLSKSTKYEELFMKMMILENKDNEPYIKYEKTEITKSLEEYNSKKIIIFDEINNTTLSILDNLTSIFNQKSILLPDASETNVGNPIIIGIINKKNNETIPENILSNLKNNSIYHVVDNPEGKDLSNIISNLFNQVYYQNKDFKKKYIKNYILNNENKSKEELSKILDNDKEIDKYYEISIQNELEIFSSKFIEAFILTKNKSIEPTFSLIDVKKYIDFRIALPELDWVYLLLFIFVYRFEKIDTQKKIMEHLNLKLTSEQIPTIGYEENNKKLYIYLEKKKSNYILIETIEPDSIIQKENKRIFNSLTQIQKLGFIFLICCYKANKVPLIQGETASGKSYLINIFSKLLGKKPIIYQITSNSGLSILTGQILIKTKIEDYERKRIKKKYKEIQSIINDKENRTFKNKADYNFLLCTINSYLSTRNLKPKDKELLTEVQKDLLEVFSLTKKTNNYSTFINAAKDGGWVVFDGIEMGHSILFDTLSSLCTENPQLKILGEKDSINLNRDNISKDFKFFFTFNSSNLGKKKINQILYNSCARFSLTPLDLSLSDSSSVLYNLLYNDEMNKKLWLKICLKLSSCHKLNVEKSELYNHLIAGGIKFSPRHLIFIGNDGKKNIKFPEDSNEIKSWIKTLFDIYYFNSYRKLNDSKNEEPIQKIKNEILNEFQKKQENIELEYLEDNKIDEEVRIILDELCKIQKSNEQNYYLFNFKNFVQKCLNIKIKIENISLIKNNIIDTIKLIFYQYDNYKKKYEQNLSNY